MPLRRRLISGAAMSANPRKRRRKYAHCPTKLRRTLVFLGTEKCERVFTLSGSGKIPVAHITGPRILISWYAKWHLFRLSWSATNRRQENTIVKRWTCSQTMVELTTMSLRLQREIFRSKPRRTLSITRWNLPRALETPNGITLNWKGNRESRKRSFLLSSCTIGICQYPDLRSNKQR